MELIHVPLEIVSSSIQAILPTLELFVFLQGQVVVTLKHLFIELNRIKIKPHHRLLSPFSILHVNVI